jgi:hypothetical protein
MLKKKTADLHLDAGEKIKLLNLTLDELIEVATSKDTYFAEREVVLKFIEAKFDPKKKEELKELFKPLEK